MINAAPPPPPADLPLLSATSPRCLGCGYVLVGLAEPRCPECGRAFDPDDPATYTTKPPFLRWRYSMPGFATALGGGVLLYAFVATRSGFGWAATLVLPACGGVLLGYGVRVRWFVLPLLGLWWLIGILMGLASLNVVGVFCGLILAGIAVGPLLVGVFVGFVLRQLLKRSRFDQRWHLPTLVSLLVPLACAEIERRTWTPPPAESVRTAAVLPTSAGRAWRALRFYEQVRAEPPAVFRWRWLGLPRPLSTTGGVGRVGERTACVYDKGRLVKEVTARREGQALEFKVVEQGFERHAMRLVGGSFAFDPVDAGHTRVTLETTYVPHLSPRWCWRPFERWTVHELHGHVLAGMAVEAGNGRDGGGELAAADTTHAQPAAGGRP